MAHHFRKVPDDFKVWKPTFLDQIRRFLSNEVASGVSKENVCIEYDPQLGSMMLALLGLDRHEAIVLPNAGSNQVQSADGGQVNWRSWFLHRRPQVSTGKGWETSCRGGFGGLPSPNLDPGSIE